MQSFLHAISLPASDCLAVWHAWCVPRTHMLHATCACVAHACVPALAALALLQVCLAELRLLASYLAAGLHTLAQALEDEEQNERLLYRMLPKHIVQQLQLRGTSQEVIVESADCAYVVRSRLTFALDCGVVLP